MFHCGFTLDSVNVTCHVPLPPHLSPAPPPLDQGDNGLIKYIV